MEWCWPSVAQKVVMHVRLVVKAPAPFSPLTVTLTAAPSRDVRASMAQVPSRYVGQKHRWPTAAHTINSKCTFTISKHWNLGQLGKCSLTHSVITSLQSIFWWPPFPQKSITLIYAWDLLNLFHWNYNCLYTGPSCWTWNFLFITELDIRWTLCTDLTLQSKFIFLLKRLV